MLLQMRKNPVHDTCQQSHSGPWRPPSLPPLHMRPVTVTVARAATICPFAPHRALHVPGSVLGTGDSVLAVNKTVMALPSWSFQSSEEVRH